MAKKILIVDDDESLRTLLKARIKSEGYEVFTAAGGREALRIIRGRKPDLVLLDIMMPDMDGQEVLKRMKEKGQDGFIPVIFLTARDATVQCLELGAADYIQKPFNSEELLARIRAQIRVKELQDELTTLSNTDFLTNCYNRRYALRILEAEIHRSKRYRIPMSCAMLDLDGFKNLNDTYGHDIGDRALQWIAELLKKNVRDIDSVCRYGGDEFLVLLPHTTLEGAVALCERLCTVIKARQFKMGKVKSSLSLSVGVASLSERGVKDGESLITRADQALYRAKRNRGKM
ncbi:MAG: diguanylate cyclase [Candidatus Aureabacteria bacterium]|nr:diguanylate cyclase [Candidatus Auribacterota bacterium]